MSLLRITVLVIAATIGPTGNAAASPDDEFRQFRDAAVQILFPRGLYLIDLDAFVCVGIEGRAADPELLTQLGTGLGHELGDPPECSCVEADPARICMRAGSSQPACSVSFSDIRLLSLADARATMIVSCGWPRGGGEIARFEQRDGVWHYAGSLGTLML